MTLHEVFVAPLADYGFMRYGMLAAVIMGATSGVVSCLMVVRRESLLGDAIAHSVLLGVVVGWLIAGVAGLYWGALVVGVATGVAVTSLQRTSRIKPDAAMGVTFTAAFALGLAVISRAQPVGIDLFHVLLGNVLGVDGRDLLLIAMTGGLVLAVIVGRFTDFQAWSFDHAVAATLGIRTGVLHYAFIAIVSLTVVTALQAVGLILVIALLVTPGAAAYLLSERLGGMMRVAAILGVISAVGGMYGSYHLDVAAGPSIVLVLTFLFLLAYFFAPRRGIALQFVYRYRGRRRVAEQDALKHLIKNEQGPRAAMPLPDLARLCEHRPGATARLVTRMARHRLVDVSTGGISLTATGEREAVRMVRAHRLLERYLHDAERVPIDRIHHEADRLEHGVSSAEVEDLARSLGQPDVDPHGHRIPKTSADLHVDKFRRLTEVPPGVVVCIEMVDDRSESALRELVRLELLPGKRIKVVGSATDGGTVLSAEHQTIELRKDLAERVVVGAGM